MVYTAIKDNRTLSLFYSQKLLFRNNFEGILSLKEVYNIVHALAYFSKYFLLLCNFMGGGGGGQHLT
jgi:hypothetical protein